MTEELDNTDWKNRFIAASIIAVFFVMLSANFYSANEAWREKYNFVLNLGEECMNSQEYQLGKLTIANWNEWMQSDFPKEGYFSCYPNGEIMACIMMSKNYTKNETEGTVITVKW